MSPNNPQKPFPVVITYDLNPLVSAYVREANATKESRSSSSTEPDDYSASLSATKQHNGESQLARGRNTKGSSQ